MCIAAGGSAISIMVTDIQISVHYATARGTVISIEHRFRAPGSAIVEFRPTLDGSESGTSVRATIEGDVSQRVGDAVTVAYNFKDPHEARLPGGDGPWFPVAFFSVIAVLSLAIAIWPQGPPFGSRARLAREHKRQ
jgi:hypothetical protein